MDKQWAIAPLDVKVRFQGLLFPKGLTYDYENHRFETSEARDFYRLVETKKDSELPSKSFLVAGVGFEPTTSWL